MSCPLSGEAPQAECSRVAGMFDSKRFLASGPVLNWWEPSDSILNPLHFNCKIGFGSLFLGFSKMKFEGVYYHAFPRRVSNSFASRVLGDRFEARLVRLVTRTCGIMPKKVCLLTRELRNEFGQF